MVFPTDLNILWKQGQTIFCRCFSLHRGLYISVLKLVTENSDVKDGCNHLDFCYSTVALLCLQPVILLPSLTT